MRALLSSKFKGGLGAEEGGGVRYISALGIDYYNNFLRLVVHYRQL